MEEKKKKASKRRKQEKEEKKQDMNFHNGFDVQLCEEECEEENYKKKDRAKGGMNG